MHGVVMLIVPAFFAKVGADALVWNHTVPAQIFAAKIVSKSLDMAAHGALQKGLAQETDLKNTALGKKLPVQLTKLAPEVFTQLREFSASMSLRQVAIYVAGMQKHLRSLCGQGQERALILLASMLAYLRNIGSMSWEYAFVFFTNLQPKLRSLYCMFSEHVLISSDILYTQLKHMGSLLNSARALAVLAAVNLQMRHLFARIISDQMTLFFVSLVMGVILDRAILQPVVNQLQLARWLNAHDIPNYVFNKQRCFTGVVTSVTDGDTIRVRHMPLFRTNAEFHGKLDDETIVVRLAGVDCPEVPHFGGKGQLYGEDAKIWVTEQLLNRRVTVKAFSKDQWARVVGQVYTGWVFKKCLAKELLKRGLAQVYRQGGAQYGGEKEEYEEIEAQAKKAKKGMWSSGGNYVNPAQYKADFKRSLP